MNRLPHGYTNYTRLVDGRVEKTYDGPRRWANAGREMACLRGLANHLPVAAVVDHDLSVPRLTLELLPGRNGQDLLAAGRAPHVLRLVGETLDRLQRLAPATVHGLDGSGPVIVHGDFGPQNMLFDLDADRVTGIVDWESAHLGNAVEDLAWTEWIVRMHHPAAVDALVELFAAARQRPSWAERQTAMIRQIRDVLAYCEISGWQESAVDWRDRLRRTEAWSGE